ncbi:MAG: 4Fe-4S binding protein [Bacteroidales bacterium]|nr:4Fe-4S binding protein [Bacteroidales bacterium]
MAEHETFYHALEFREDLCMGCSHCMMKCPTGAIRVIDGKARLNPDRCIDCGECFQTCPYGAISVKQDDFEKIYNYKYRIALMPSVFSAQFPDKVTYSQIYKALITVGFTQVYETENTVDSLVKPYNEYIGNHEDKPVISSFCPAIVRLIQVRFPTLVDNIMLIKPPMDVTAMLIKKKYEDEGIPFSEVGIFYVTPCAAKIAGIKSSVVDDNSLISGVINMNFLYNKVYRVIKQNAYLPELADANDVDFEKMSKRSLHWSLTTGEVRVVNSAKKMAIDQVHNVIEFLEKVENGDIEDIDFLELRACYQSCAGGVLCAGNKFLTTDRARRRASNILGDTLQREDMEKYSQYLEDNCLIDGKIEPRSIVKLDDDMAEAMKKMKRINEINNILPQVDCGICGTPSCQAFAEDIVQKKADIKRCIFVQKILQQNDKLELSEATEIMKQTWGVGKLDKNLVRELKDELETED